MRNNVHRDITCFLLLREWVYGGEDFLKRVLSLAEGDIPVLKRGRIRRANPISVDAVLAATALQNADSVGEYVGLRRGAAGYVCRAI